MITQTLDLNLIPGRVLPMVNVSQYDKDSRTLEFTIYNGDQSFDLTGLSAYIQGLKPDGHGFNYSANISAGKITADITEQMTTVSGRVMCEVIIMDGTDRIGTGNFILNVEAAAMPDNANMSASEYAYIQELIEEAQEVVDEAEGYVEDAEAWAKGTRNGTAVPNTDPTYHNNSKYYSEVAKDNEEDSEAWAIGTRNGSPVPATDPTYQNNAKYWSDQASGAVNDMTGATATTPGAHGLVPAPAAGDQGKFLKGDGTWGTISQAASGISYNNAQSGLSATDTQGAIDELSADIGGRIVSALRENAKYIPANVSQTYDFTDTTKFKSGNAYLVFASQPYSTTISRMCVLVFAFTTASVLLPLHVDSNLTVSMSSGVLTVSTSSQTNMNYVDLGRYLT